MGLYYHRLITSIISHHKINFLSFAADSNPVYSRHKRAAILEKKHRNRDIPRMMAQFPRTDKNRFDEVI